MAEARRAGDTDLSSATAACPLGVDLNALVRASQQGDFDAALGAVMSAHPWAMIMGDHCQRPCERAHGLPGDAEPINLSQLERAAGALGNRSRFPFMPGSPTGKRVAIVGAGSASSAAAHRLRRHGHHVALYDQLPVSGGMMFVGYPNFRLPLAVLRAENAVEAWGCEPHYGVHVDRALMDQLLAEYDAVILGTGKFDEVHLDVPGEDLRGVWGALSFLTEFKLGKNPPTGRRVVVVGAGYTAQDSSRTCRRLGCDVTVFYRRTKDEMPLLPHLREMHIARQIAEGAPYIFETTVTRILGRDGMVSGVIACRTRPDGSGGVELVPGSEYEVACDTVIEATGERVDLSYVPEDVVIEGGHIKVDPQTWMTARKGLFACGEMTGIPTTVQAFRTGFACGEAVHNYLSC